MCEYSDWEIDFVPQYWERFEGLFRGWRSSWGTVTPRWGELRNSPWIYFFPHYVPASFGQVLCCSGFPERYHWESCRFCLSETENRESSKVEKKLCVVLKQLTASRAVKTEREDANKTVSLQRRVENQVWLNGFEGEGDWAFIWRGQTTLLGFFPQINMEAQRTKFEFTGLFRQIEV